METNLSKYEPSAFRAILMTARHLNIDQKMTTTELRCGPISQKTYLWKWKHDPYECVRNWFGYGIKDIYDNRFILKYLCNQYAPDSELYPKDLKKRAVVDRWLDMSIDMSSRDFQMAVLVKIPLFGEELTEEKMIELNNNLKLFDQMIGDNKYLTGNELTIADIAILVNIDQIEFVNFAKVNLSEYRNLSRWLTSMKSELPCYEEFNHSEEEEFLAFVEKIKGLLLYLRYKNKINF